MCYVINKMFYLHKNEYAYSNTLIYIYKYKY